MQLSVQIPVTFARARVTLGWRDVALGIAERLIDPSIAIDLAVERMAADEEGDGLLELASASAGDPVAELVQGLADAESGEDHSRDKWLYLVLAWIYENREQQSDPLALVEQAYAEFDYPEEVASFVRYMPMHGPDLGSRQANEARMFESWRRYLERASQRFSAS